MEGGKGKGRGRGRGKQNKTPNSSGPSGHGQGQLGGSGKGQSCPASSEAIVGQSQPAVGQGDGPGGNQQQQQGRPNAWNTVNAKAPLAEAVSGANCTAPASGDAKADAVADKVAASKPESKQVPLKGGQKPEGAQVLEKLAGLKLTTGVDYAKKQSPGTKGRTENFVSNMVPVVLKENLVVYHYDVTIARNNTFRPSVAIDENRVLPKSINYKVMSTFVSQNRAKGKLFAGVVPVFDGGKNLYTRKVLDLPEAFEAQVSLLEDNQDKNAQSFVAKLKKADPFEIAIPAKAKTYNQEAIQILDIILRYGTINTKIALGQKTFYPFKSNPQSRKYLARNIQLAYGFYQSVRCCDAGLALNVDRVAGTFYQGGHMLDVLCRLMNKNTINPNEEIPDMKRVSMGKDLKGLHFRAQHLQKRQMITGLSRLPVSQIYFDLEEVDSEGKPKSRKISVMDYFFEKYKIKLRYAKLPCLTTKIKGREAYFPLEVCELLEDQVVKKKLPADIGAMFTKEAVQRPHRRFQEIRQGVEAITREGKECMDAFGISLVHDFIKATGRIIDTPDLCYKNKSFRPPPETTWTMQGGGKKFLYKAIPLDNWVAVGFGGQRDETIKLLNDFAAELIKVGKEMGFPINTPKANVRYTFKDVKDLKQNLFGKAVTTFKDVKMLVCVIPQDGDIYNGIKEVGDVECGIPTQCVNYGKHGDKIMSKAYLSNLLLNMNAKLGGINVVPADIPDKTMVVGIDVTHPSPGAKLAQSIAACVATFDNTLTQFDAKITVQKPFEDEHKRKKVYEMVELGSVIEDLLNQYKNKNANLLPEKILVFRDGVSEGQFGQVMEKELRALLALFKDEKRPPKITYIVVQKRHNVRIATLSKLDNPSPGTIVDVAITDPTIFDFFLCSHKAIQGTSRPTRYRVLFDQNGLTSDEIQRFTNSMCFTYSASTKAISIPAPVKYADLAAYRARIHLGDADDRATVLSDDEDGDGGEIPAEVLERLNEAVRVSSGQRCKQYFV